jgi:uncharacterized protein YaaN involved in tellurite resistance
MSDKLAELNFDTLCTFSFDPLKSSIEEIIKRLQKHDEHIRRLRRNFS